jgi:hypothetical protein
VIAALATKLCEITDGISNEPDLTGFDLKCALPSGATPTTLAENLQAIITYICSLPTSSGSDYTEPNINLCADLQYPSPAAGGGMITSLPLSAYALLVGNKLCTIIQSIATLTTQVNSIDTRVTTLEAFFPLPTATEVQIIPNCVTATAGALTNVSVVVAALESSFCNLRTATGTPAVINNAVAQQAILNTNNLLSQSGQTYSAQTGWKTSPVNMANSLQNAWIVIKDLYDAVEAIQTNCCPGACDSLTFDFSATRLLDSNSLTTHVILDFSGSIIPSGFADSAGTTPVTITDGAGNVITQNINITSLAQTPPNSTNIPVTTGLNENGTLTVVINSSFTKDSDVCQETKTKSVAASIPCPADTASSNITSVSFDVSFTNILGTNAVYTIDIMDGSVVIATSGAINNPGGTVTESFTGLTPNTDYDARITVVYDGETKVCPLFAIKTADAAPPCNQGIDIVFAFDYTGSMGGDMNTAKAAATSLISTIKTASGHPTYEYKIGLMIYDESNSGLNQVPNYNTQTNYSTLPANQRVIQNGTNNNTLFFTAMEMLQTNNETSFTTQLNTLNNGTNLSIGDGGSGPEPGLPAVSQIVNMNLCGAFRSNVAKIIVLLTDNTEGGVNDIADAADVTLGNNLASVLNSQGIKFIAMGAGANSVIGGVAIYEALAAATGGTTTTTFNASAVATAITNACGGS